MEGRERRRQGGRQMKMQSKGLRGSTKSREEKETLPQASRPPEDASYSVSIPGREEASHLPFFRI